MVTEAGAKKRRTRLIPPAFFAIAATSIFFPLFGVSCEVEGREATRLSFTGGQLAVGNRGTFRVVDTRVAQSLGFSPDDDVEEIVPDRPPEPLVIAALAFAVLGLVLGAVRSPRLLGGLFGVGGLICLLALWAKAAGETAGFNRSLARAAEAGVPTFRLTVQPAFWIAATAFGVIVAEAAYRLLRDLSGGHGNESEGNPGGLDQSAAVDDEPDRP